MDTVDRLMLPDAAGKAIRRVAYEPAGYQVNAATTATVSEVAFWVAPVACRVNAVYFVGSTTVTPAAGSNTHTMTITKYDGAGGAGTTVATGTIANATPATQYQKLTFTNGVTTVAADSVLTFKTAVAGTATLPAGVVVVETVFD